MGYTNYHRGVTPTREIAEDARKIIATAQGDGIAICGPAGKGEPVLTAQEISFNGDASKDQDYESFTLYAEDHPHSGTPLSQFCKTGHRPYDAAVIATLVSAFIREQQSSSSDGKFGLDKEIAAGIALFERAVRPLTAEERVDVEAMFL